MKKLLEYKSPFRAKNASLNELKLDERRGNYHNEIVDLVFEGLRFNTNIPSQAYAFYAELHKRLQRPGSGISLRAAARELAEEGNLTKTQGWKDYFMNTAYFSILSSLPNDSSVLPYFKSLLNNASEKEDFMREVYQNLEKIRSIVDVVDILLRRSS